MLCRTLVFSDTLPYGIPVVFLWFCIVFYGYLVFSSIVYSTLVFGCAVPRHGIKIFGLSIYVSPGIILSPIGMMFTRPGFSPAKY
nr:MAG TPA: hypothetical protein [Caudoviricetes sp.]